MTLRENGNIGLGTSNPESILHLKNPSYTGDTVIEFTNGDADNASIQYDFDSDGFEFRTNGTESVNTNFFIGNTSNVGIGTTILGSKLQVMGTIRADNDITKNSTAFVSTGGLSNFQIRHSNISNVVNIVNSGSQYGAFSFGGYLGNNFILTSDGNVGIGTTNPNEKLVIGNDIWALTTARAIVVGNDGTGPGDTSGGDSHLILAKDVNNFGAIYFDQSAKTLKLRTRTEGNTYFGYINNKRR